MHPITGPRKQKQEILKLPVHQTSCYLFTQARLSRLVSGIEPACLQVSSQRSPAVKREGSGATGGAGAQRPADDSSTSSGEPLRNALVLHL